MNFGKRNTAQPGQVECHLRTVGTHGHTGNRGRQVGGHGGGRAIDRGCGFEGVGTGGRDFTVIVQAIPGEVDAASLLGTQLDGAHQLVVLVVDPHRSRGTGRRQVY
ncbi:hypothetical protein D3C76_1400530 [compost metagenome]